MNYANFEGAITEKHGIVIENWPLKTFCSPSDVKSRNEVKVLLHAWESGTSRFRLMSADEWQGWSEGRLRQALNDGAPPTNPTPSSDNTAPPTNPTHSSDNPTPPPNPTPSSDNTTSPTNLTPSSDNTTPPINPTPSSDSVTPQDSTPPTPAPSSSHNPGNSTNEPRRKKKKAGVDDNFMNTTAVGMASGTVLVTSRKTRKTRSDKGVRRKRVD